MRMKKKNDKGITLIALIITIIVMLLLVGVTLNVALQGGLFGNAKEASLGQAHSMVMELLKTEEFTYLTEKESGKTTLALTDYLKEKGIITAEEEEGKYKINVEVLLGTAGSTGNGTDGKDIYTLEKANGEETSGENEGTKYDVKYYNNNGESEQVGELVDLAVGSNEDDLITFYIDYDHNPANRNEYTVRKGMTWKEFVESILNLKVSVFPDDRMEIEGSLPGTNSNVHLIKESLENYEFDIVGPNDPIHPDGKYYTETFICISPTSKIATSTDGKYTLAKDMSIGDKIAYYDFETSSTKVGTVEKVYIHKKATNFVRYEFNDGTYLEATDYHPIYTKEGWKSLTRRNNYPVPCEGDSVKTLTGWKEITKIETYTGVEDFYDFSIVAKDGSKVQNYFANGALVQSSL